MATIFCIVQAKPLSVVWLILLVCSQIRVSDASIRVLTLGKEYQSRPDKYVGLQMEDGIEYGARLQSIQRDVLDQHLCGGEQWNVTVPDDGRPVALLVKKGLCSNAQKAEFASRNIHPPGIVKVLIIDGELRIKDDDDDTDPYEIDYNLDRHQDDSKDKKSVPISSYESPTYYNWSNESTVTLRRRQADDISVTLLHVSYATGVKLLDVVLHEDHEVQKEGGTVVTVDGVSPPLSRTVVVIWFTACVAVSLLCCICLVNCIQELLEDYEPEPEPPRRRRRRRLTLDQVKKLPIGTFDGMQLVYDEESIGDKESGEDAFSHLEPQAENMCVQPVGHSLDACTICLDEYEIGDVLRCLPCGHAFHANCIAKWLIERSATCPLCKIDLYEEDDDDEDEDNEIQRLQTETQIIEVTETIEHSTATDTSGEAWWRNIFRSTEDRLRVSEALTERLLQHHEHYESGRSEAEIIEETQISEVALTTSTNQPNTIVDETNTI